MSDPIQKMSPEKGSIEEIMMQIPGFRGYLQKENRRDADRVQRQYLGDRLKQAKQDLDQVKLDLAKKLAFDHLTTVESLTDKVYRVRSRIENADQGYSGFFDSMKVGEKELDTLYQFDKELIGDVNAILDATTTLKSADKDALGESLDAVDTRIQALDDKFDKRKQLIQGVL